MSDLTQGQVVELLCWNVDNAGSQSELARIIGISAQYLNDVLRGNRKPGVKILDFLGLEKVEVYRCKR